MVSYRYRQERKESGETPGEQYLTNCNQEIDAWMKHNRYPHHAANGQTFRASRAAQLAEELLARHARSRTVTGQQPSFMPKRYNWIYLHGTPCGNPNRKQKNHYQKTRNGDVRKRIPSVDAKKSAC